MICQVCKGLSSPQWCDQVTNLRTPLDNTPIYPIALSRSYLCLEHSTWVRWWLSWSLQVVHLSWLRVQAHAWWRLLQILPHAHNGRVSLSSIFMYPLQAPSIGSLQEASLGLGLAQLIFSSLRWCLESSRHTCNKLHSTHELQEFNTWTPPFHG